jgi:BlaI family transcriptional regulator, penicillinase repressor
MTHRLRSLSPSETEILRLLWDAGSGTVQAIADRLPADRKIAYATVQTLLRRLESKGYVRHRLVGKAHVFEPLEGKDKVIQSAVGSFLQRLFGGDAVPLVMHLARHRKLTLEDVERLKQLIEEDQT